MHPWTELETDMPADFLFVFLISAAPAPASSFFVCVCVDGVTKSRTLVSYKVDISDGSGCDCFLSLFANDAKRGRGGSVRSKKGRRKCAFVECKRAPSPPRPARSRDSHRTSAVVHQPGCVCVCVCVCSSSSLNRLVLRAEPRPPYVCGRDSGANPATSSSSSSSQSQPLINPYVANDIAPVR
jgi:hypothetical protein